MQDIRHLERYMEVKFLSDKKFSLKMVDNVNEFSFTQHMGYKEFPPTNEDMINYINKWFDVLNVKVICSDNETVYFSYDIPERSDCYEEDEY